MPYPTREEILEAHKRIAPIIHRTPVLTSQSLNEMLGCEIHFKCENFQKVGAFKIRGATNAIWQIDAAELQNGVATHSSGNHAQAVAFGAKAKGIPAHIVMPSTAPKVKKAAVIGYGATVYECAPTLAARESTLEEVVAKTGAFFIHPFDNHMVVTGQATAAIELMEDAGGAFDAIMAPVGGGGLLSGTALACKYFSEGTKVYAGEPTGADDAYQSMKAGKLIPSVNPDTIADGLLTSLSPRTFEIINNEVEEIFTVNDEEIMAALRLVWERLKVIIEPSCAVPVAALIKNKEKFQGQKVGIIFSGGNVELEKLKWS